jgi:2-polyprenyl-6-methoxyphenol hydroxylase-like FAD-dependent oxidoreductase
VRALICGAGIAGLTLARLLCQQGWSVSLAERAGGLRPEGYMIDFFGPGFDAAEAIGLLPRLQQLAYQVSEVSYVDRIGRSRAALDYGRIARSLDGRLLSLLRGDLALALHEGLGSGVEMRYNTSVRTIEETADDVHATLTDGSRWRGDLLVGADGIHSVVRSLMFGPESAYLRFLGFHTAAYTFEDPDLHRRLGDRFAITDSPNRAVGVYGLRNRRIAVFTCTGHPSQVFQTIRGPRSAPPTRIWAGSCPTYSPTALHRAPCTTTRSPTSTCSIGIPDAWSWSATPAKPFPCSPGKGASLAVAGAHLLASLR